MTFTYKLSRRLSITAYCGLAGLAAYRVTRLHPGMSKAALIEDLLEVVLYVLLALALALRGGAH